MKRENKSLSQIPGFYLSGDLFLIVFCSEFALIVSVWVV
jgi:hypothetical protein